MSIAIIKLSWLLDLKLIGFFMVSFSVHSQRMTKLSITCWHHLCSQNQVCVYFVLFCMLGNCVKTDKTQNLTNCSQFFISLHFFYSFGPSIIWMWSTREELWERKTQTIKVSTNVIFNWNIILSIIDRFIGYCQWKLNFNWFLFYFFRASAGVWLEGWCRQRCRDLLLHSLSDKPSHWLTCNVLVILWQISCQLAPSEQLFRNWVWGKHRNCCLSSEV